MCTLFPKGCDMYSSASGEDPLLYAYVDRKDIGMVNGCIKEQYHRWIY